MKDESRFLLMKIKIEQKEDTELLEEFKKSQKNEAYYVKSFHKRPNLLFDLPVIC